MSKNGILRKTHFKVSITAKKSEILIHTVILSRYYPSPILNYIYPLVSQLINHCVDYKMAEMDLKTGHGLF